MIDAKERAEQAKARHRAILASIVEGLRATLESDEQLLAFARGRLAGGWRGKLTIGPEAFFAPYVNIGLTDRRFILQHIHVEDGKPSEILPHIFPVAEIVSISFSGVETFSAEVAGRLSVHLNDEQRCRIRLLGEGNVENARALVEVYQSLSAAKRAAPSPTQSVCAHCGHILDQPSRFCPYCGSRRIDVQATPTAAASAAPHVETPPTATASPVTESMPTASAPPAPTMETEAPVGEAAPRVEPDIPFEPVSDVALTREPVAPEPDALEPEFTPFAAETEVVETTESVVDTTWTPTPAESAQTPPEFAAWREQNMVTPPVASAAPESAAPAPEADSPAPQFPAPTWHWHVAPTPEPNAATATEPSAAIETEANVAPTPEANAAFGPEANVAPAPASEGSHSPTAPPPHESAPAPMPVDPELADEIHRFTEEGGSPPAIAHDDDVPLQDGALPPESPTQTEAEPQSDHESPSESAQTPPQETWPSQGWQTRGYDPHILGE